ncbi:protein lifeguard 1-like [Cochliomyia hominivorax]
MATDTWNNNYEKTSLQSSDASNLPDMESQCKRLLFDDNSIRKDFIRKVYLILMSQLLMTFSIVAIFMLNESLKAIFITNPVIFWPAFIVLVVTMLIMACCDDVRRTTPLNYIFLAIFTLAQSLLLAIVTCQYDSLEILLAVGTTAAICLALSLYALQTKYDFTMMGGILLMSLVIFLIFSLFTIFIPLRPIFLLYSSMGVVVFSVYMIYDTQLMLGGRHKYTVQPEEYVFAALNLYLDIINIFIHVMSLIIWGRT